MLFVTVEFQFPGFCRPQKPYRRIVADYGARRPVGTQSVNVSAPSTSSAPVSSGQASGQASSAGSTAASVILVYIVWL